VVRSRLHGTSIARVAPSAVVQRAVTAPLAALARSREERNRLRRFQVYPLWDFLPMMAVAHPGAPRLVGVGLRMPPVPKREGRPPVADITP